MYLHYSPLVDYEKYVDLIVEKVQDFLKPAPSKHLIDRPTPEWAAEQLLITFQRFQSNITPARIIDSIVEKWRSIKHEFTPPKVKDIILCNINSIDYYSDSQTPVLNLSLNNSTQGFNLWLHESIIQFVHTSILSPSRKIRFISSQILNDSFMLPVRCVIFELNDGSISDLNWAKENAQKNTLLSLRSSKKQPNAVIVNIINKTETSFMVKDDSISEPIELILKSQEQDYLKLLDEYDIILIWKPIICLNPFCIELSSKSAIFRAPVPKMGQNQREIMKCGVVDSIGHYTSNDEWTGCQMDIISKGGIRNTILFSQETNYYYKKILSTLQIGHFTYIFHLVGYDENTYRFSKESTIYNLNTITSFLDSMVVRPIPITKLYDYSSGIVRAVIISIEIKRATIHFDCGCQVNDRNFCQRCLSSIEGRFKNVILNKVTIDDGSDILTVYGFSSEFNLIGIDISEWETLSQKVKDEIIGHFIGKEYVFFLTKANPADFNMDEVKMKGEFIWRVDTFSEGKEETKRAVRFLVDHFKSNSNEKYQVGSIGDSPFFFKKDS